MTAPHPLTRNERAQPQGPRLESAHARIERLARYTTWVAYVGNVLALGGCMATLLCWVQGRELVGLRCNVTGFGLWLIMVATDQLLLRRARGQLALLRSAAERPRSPLRGRR